MPTDVSILTGHTVLVMPKATPPAQQETTRLAPFSTRRPPTIIVLTEVISGASLRLASAQSVEPGA